MSGRKPRIVKPSPRDEEPAVRNALVDFSDPDSQRVLDAIADALLAPLAIQQARHDHIEWLTSQKRHS
jgi:hypothetical protein